MISLAVPRGALRAWLMPPALLNLTDIDLTAIFYPFVLNEA
jgi:hypothetical protein